jgi:hypothetical protein
MQPDALEYAKFGLLHQLRGFGVAELHRLSAYKGQKSAMMFC